MCCINTKGKTMFSKRNWLKIEPSLHFRQRTYALIHNIYFCTLILIFLQFSYTLGKIIKIKINLRLHKKIVIL